MDVDMMSIMMQMEKPSSPNSHHNHHHQHQHHHHNSHLQFCDDPNSTPTSFLDVNFFSDHHHHSNIQPQHNNNNNPNNTSNNNSYMGLTNPNNNNIHHLPNNNARALFNKSNNTSGATMARSHHHHNNNNSMAAMREMIFRIAAMQPIHIDPEAIKPPKRRNVRISKDPQSVAARHRRERISERIRILQRLVPGGTKMDTASMLDEAIHYVKFLKNQVQTLEQAGAHPRLTAASGVLGFPVVGPGMSGSTNNLSYNSGCASPMAESMCMLR